MDHKDKLLACVQLGVEMRAAQKNYFRLMRQDDLRKHWLAESRKLEKQFDEAAKYVLALTEKRQTP